MAAEFKTFWKDARTKPVSRKGAVVAVYGAFVLISFVIVLIEVFVGGRWLSEALQALVFFTCFSFMLASGGLWKEQTQTAADRRV